MLFRAAHVHDCYKIPLNVIPTLQNMTLNQERKPDGPRPGGTPKRNRAQDLDMQRKEISAKITYDIGLKKEVEDKEPVVLPKMSKKNIVPYIGQKQKQTKIREM